MIDSKERLTVQVHPDRETAKRLFGSPFGKTEYWHILNTREDCEEKPCLYLGFKEGITRKEWEKCFFEQDYDRMLGLMNCLEVKPGETYLVKGGSSSCHWSRLHSDRDPGAYRLYYSCRKSDTVWLYH